MKAPAGEQRRPVNDAIDRIPEMPSTLFSQSYLEAGLRETEEYQQISPQILSHFGQDLRAPYSAFLRAYQASNGSAD